MATDEWGYDLNRDKQMRYAHRNGYYWLPCVLCGFETGGHESAGSPMIPIKGHTNLYQGVCRRHPNAEREFVYVEAHVEPASPDRQENK